jgi:transposase-like protein
VPKPTISTIADKAMDGMAEWQNRPLDRVYPVLFDANPSIYLGHGRHR